MTGVSTAGSSGTAEGRTEGAPGGMEEEVPLKRTAARGDGGTAVAEEEGGSPGGAGEDAQVHHHARACRVFAFRRNPRDQVLGRWRGRSPFLCAKTGSGPPPPPKAELCVREAGSSWQDALIPGAMRFA